MLMLPSLTTPLLATETTRMDAVLALITSDPIDEETLRRAVMTDADGALVLFSGVVRNHDQGRSIRSLDYEAHPQAQQLLAECCQRIADESGLAVAAVHRIGSLKIGDIALTAAVASAHRQVAFDTCARLVDEIKLTVPIWKRQHTMDGVSEWVGL